MDRGVFPHLRVNTNPAILMKRNWQKIMMLADPGQLLLIKTHTVILLVIPLPDLQLLQHEGQHMSNNKQ